MKKLLTVLLVIMSMLGIFSVSAMATDLKVSGYGQVQLVNDASAVDKETYVTIKRVRLSAKTNVDKVGLFFQMEAFTAAINTLDLIIDYDLGAAGKAGVGRFTVPTGIQGPISPYSLMTINYAPVVLNMALARDFGVRLVGKSGILNWNVAALNGTATTTTPVATTEDNNVKDIAGRLGVAAMPGLEVGVSFYGGQAGAAKVTKDRTGVDLKYEKGPLCAQAEYISGKDAALNKAGYYAEFGYMLSNNIQPVLRYDNYDGDTSIEDATEISTIAAGLNYYINDASKMQFIYEAKNDKAGAGLSDLKNDVATVQFAVKF